ncbi:Ectonucleoside triphosphate diphosphohydrolase 4 [Stylophora pistillata]|uniref:Ectonucleoside triphosphate diphosphohydrolase 4 n=1 Tax=Stylophora pistillata TaxID=50429 RepID=A0A2B4SEZ6_STYPI|nr:Ectonucleoside triphosphate diphosphohydrolase 4 [Stylophora pistillata]
MVNTTAYTIELWMHLGALFLVGNVNWYGNRTRRFASTDFYKHGADSHYHYGIVIDCGSSGSRVFIYYWPPHNGNPEELLQIKQMKDNRGNPVRMKIKPGISSQVNWPSEASSYIDPLLSFAAQQIPEHKHKETPLYILATAGMRMLSVTDQEAILDDLRVDVPLKYNFHFTSSHVEVITGKQEGIYSWIGVNFELGRFDHSHDSQESPPNNSASEVNRKSTVGSLDMGGGSAQIAFEVGKSATSQSKSSKQNSANVTQRRQYGKAVSKECCNCRDGRDGRDGKNGMDGRDGRDGKMGEKGVKGEVGIQGKDGIEGKKGQKGEPGPESKSPQGVIKFGDTAAKCTRRTAGTVRYKVPQNALLLCDGSNWLPLMTGGKGHMASTPGRHCRDILRSGGSRGSGLYWIDPNGGSTEDSFQAFCDMETESGGWTLVATKMSPSFVFIETTFSPSAAKTT